MGWRRGWCPCRSAWRFGVARFRIEVWPLPRGRWRAVVYVAGVVVRRAEASVVAESRDEAARLAREWCDVAVGAPHVEEYTPEGAA